MILDSWAPSTKKQYKPYIQKWEVYCRKNNANSLSPTLFHGTQFLWELFHTGVGYSVCNTARSALSSVLSPIDGVDFGDHPVVCRLLRGMLKNRPSLPRYVVTFDANRVLNYLKRLPGWEEITLKCLTFKFTTLLALLSGHRCQTLNVLSLDSMDISPDRVVFYIPSIIKNTSPSFHAAPICLRSFSDESVCPVRNTIEYIKRTAWVRKCRTLIISFSNFSAISTQTVRRYVKATLDSAGVVIKTLGPPASVSSHATRHAASAKAKADGVPLKDILKSGGWKNDNTFRKHYDLPIIDM